MGQKKNGPECGITRLKTRSLRRGFMPEPPFQGTKPFILDKNSPFTIEKHSLFNPTQLCPQPEYYVNFMERSSQVSRCPPEPKYCRFIHTSCISALRSCFHSGRSHKRKKRNKPIVRRENAEKLICSLKNDIQIISRYEEDFAKNPSKKPSSEPCFVLSAMMCKVNKLEGLVLTEEDCRDQLMRARDLRYMVKCFKKNLMDQICHDEQALHTKQERLLGLVQNLDMFETEIKYMANSIKKKCCPPPKGLCAIENQCCGEKVDCGTDCCEPSHEKPCLIGGGCSDGNFDITGMNVTYTKSHVISDCAGNKREDLRNRVSYCAKDDAANCQLTLLKDGKELCPDSCDPSVQRKIESLSRVWFESARQLLGSFNCDNTCC